MSGVGAGRLARVAIPDPPCAAAPAAGNGGAGNDQQRCQPRWNQVCDVVEAGGVLAQPFPFGIAIAQQRVRRVEEAIDQRAWQTAHAKPEKRRDDAVRAILSQGFNCCRRDQAPVELRDIPADKMPAQLMSRGGQVVLIEIPRHRLPRPHQSSPGKKQRQDRRLNQPAVPPDPQLAGQPVPAQSQQTRAGACGHSAVDQRSSRAASRRALPDDGDPPSHPGDGVEARGRIAQPGIEQQRKHGGVHAPLPYLSSAACQPCKLSCDAVEKHKAIPHFGGSPGNKKPPDGGRRAKIRCRSSPFVHEGGRTNRCSICRFVRSSICKGGLSGFANLRSRYRCGTAPDWFLRTSPVFPHCAPRIRALGAPSQSEIQLSRLIYAAPV